MPSAGKQTGRAAQEVAFSLARQLGARTLIAHVVTTPSPRRALRLRRRAELQHQAAAAEAAEHVVEEARARAAEFGAPAEAEIRIDVSAPDALLAIAREHAVDLVVLAANLRQFSGRPFLGHGVEYLLEQCESTVVVVTLPPGWAGTGPTNQLAAPRASRSVDPGPQPVALGGEDEVALGEAVDLVGPDRDAHASPGEAAGPGGGSAPRPARRPGW